MTKVFRQEQLRFFLRVLRGSALNALKRLTIVFTR
jgi:hypothetical protein